MTRPSGAPRDEDCSYAHKRQKNLSPPLRPATRGRRRVGGAGGDGQAHGGDPRRARSPGVAGRASPRGELACSSRKGLDIVSRPRACDATTERESVGGPGAAHGETLARARFARSGKEAGAVWRPCPKAPSQDLRFRRRCARIKTVSGTPQTPRRASFYVAIGRIGAEAFRAALLSSRAAKRRDARAREGVRPPYGQSRSRPGS